MSQARGNEECIQMFSRKTGMEERTWKTSISQLYILVFYYQCHDSDVK
jgi:hypothetical protein